MANLGSDNTPIEGESFGLPSGYSFDEENGDLVIRDTDGTVAMRRADGTAWQLEGSDISGVGAFDSESVNTEYLDSTEIDVGGGDNADSPLVFEREDGTTVQIGGDSSVINASDYGSLQAAIDDANPGMRVEIADSVSEEVVIDKAMTLAGGSLGDGSTIVGGSSDPVIEIESNNVIVHSLEAEQQGSGETILCNSVANVVINQAQIRGGDLTIDSGSSEIKVSKCRGSSAEINISGDENIVFGNTNFDNINNNGTDNEIGLNT